MRRNGSREKDRPLRQGQAIPKNLNRPSAFTYAWISPQKGGRIRLRSGSTPPASSILLLAEFGDTFGFRAVIGKLFGLKKFAHSAAGEEPVQRLGSLFGHFHFEPGCAVHEENAGLGLVYVLATRSAALHEGFVEIGFAESAGRHSPEEFEFFGLGDAEFGHTAG